VFVAGDQLIDEACLAGPGVSPDDQGPGVTRDGVVERPLSLGELDVPPDERSAVRQTHRGRWVSTIVVLDHVFPLQK
jgi:hypothetical protein